MKKIATGKEARRKLISGANKVADIVGSTMGPSGRNVVFGTQYQTPTVTNDGFLSGVQVQLEDKIEQLGADLINVGTGRTNTTVRAGRTTTTVLSQALINQYGFSKNPMRVREKLLEEVEEVCRMLDEVKIPVEGIDEIRHIATVASESEDIGRMIADLVDKIGKDGVVDVQESQEPSIIIERVKGLRVEEGYLSPYMINNERGEAVIEDAHVLVTSEKITSIKELLPTIEKIAKAGIKKLVLVCDGVDSVSLGTFIQNKMQGNFEVIAMKLPSDSKQETALDIATVTGGEVFSPSTGMMLKDFVVEDLGRADRVVMKDTSTTFIGGKGNVTDAVAHLKTLDQSYKRDKRIANLMGGVAIIKVGASTDTEMKYLRMKIDDAVSEAQAAIAEGVVEGGGVALYRISLLLPRKSLLRKALQAPVRKIIENSESNVFLTLLRLGLYSDMGYDAKSREIVNMFEKGILDPVKVTKSVLRNAVSCAGIFITTDAVISKEYETTKN